jgi:hypothetical protein
MATLTGQNIVDRAWIILQDTNGGNGVRWPQAEVLMWLNDGQREVVINLPSAYVKTAIATLTAGTRQTLQGLGFNDGIQFIKYVRNFLADGLTPGRAVTVRPMLWLDEQRPTWHSDAAGETIHCFFEVTDPKSFYVWPKASGTTKGEITYSAAPPELANLASVISIDDIYANALQYYVLFRAFSKNATYTRAPQMATAYYQLFLQGLGIKDQRVKALDANMQMLSDGVGGPGGPGGATG